MPSILALQIDMSKTFDKGEILSAKISGNFVKPILQKNIFLYKGHVRTPFEPYITKINENYYIYAIVPEKTPGNYSLVIKNSEYYSGMQTFDKDIEIDFFLTNKTADFSIDKGFILANQTFYIKVQNLKALPINININTESDFSGELKPILENSNSSIYLKSGEIEKIYFKPVNFRDLENAEITLYSSNNTKYNIPVQIINSFASSKIEKALKFDSPDLNLSISTNSANRSKIIYLRNIGEQPINNISLEISNSLKNYITLGINYLDKLNEKSTLKTKIYVTPGNKTKKIEGYIRASNSKIEDHLFINLNIIKDYLPENKSIWDDNKTIEENIEPSENLQDNNSNLSFGKIIGWSILIIVGIFIAWFFMKKYKGAKKNTNLIKKGKSDFKNK